MKMIYLIEIEILRKMKERKQWKELNTRGKLESSFSFS